jgi:hypothetical protein
VRVSGSVRGRRRRQKGWGIGSWLHLLGPLRAGTVISCAESSRLPLCPNRRRRIRRDAISVSPLRRGAGQVR